MIHKVPPQNIRAEEALLGAILLNHDFYDQARTVISGEDFYSPKHRVIFGAIEAGALDIVTACHALNATGKLEEIGGPAYIASLTNVIPTSSGVSAHAKLIREAAKKRRFIQRAGEMIETCYNRFDFDNIAADLEQEAFAMAEAIGDGGEAKHLGPVAREALAKCERIKNGQEQPGVMTGYSDLDAILGGLKPADLAIIAARPGMGKTALAMNIIRRSAQNGTASGIFSLEMNAEQIGVRAIADLSKINSKGIMSGWVGEDGLSRAYRAADELDALPIYVDDTPALHISEMRSRARRMARKHNVGLIVLDYIQMAQGSGGNREQEVADISRGLKGMAKELKIPVVALAQLNRSLESRADKRPMLSDLRESGSIEQDADVIIFIYRDDYYNKQSQKKGTAEIIIAKQRSGPVGMVEMAWKPETTSFENLQRHDHWSDER